MALTVDVERVAALDMAHRPELQAPVDRELAPLLEEPVAGVTARALLDQAGNRRRLAPERLEAWLVESGFAIDDDGLLRPTELGLEVGGALQPAG